MNNLYKIKYMKNKIVLLLITFIILFMVTGCGEEYKSYEPLSEDEVIDFVKNTIYDDLKEEVDVEIIDKREVIECAFYLDGCIGPHKVPNTFVYDLKITNKENPQYNDTSNHFTDSYLINDTIVERKLDYKSYKEISAISKLDSEIREKIKGVEVYTYYRYPRLQVYLYSNNYDYLGNLFSYLLNDYILDKDNPNDIIANYDIYVIKNYELFKSIDFSSNYDITQHATNLKNTYGYAREYMEIEHVDGYQNVFFRYSSNGCNGNKSCSVLYGLN